MHSAIDSLTISIVTYKSEQNLLVEVLDKLASAIEYLQENKEISGYRLVIIDNGGSKQDFRRKVEAYSTRIPVIYRLMSTNIGYGAAHNVAIREFPADIHLVLNPDVYLARTAIYEAMLVLQERSDTSLVCPRGLLANNEQAHLAKRYPSLVALGARALKLQRLFLATIARYEYHDLPDNEVSPIQLASGCCMFIRGERLRAIGGFDEKYFLYFEDYDLSIRLSNSGLLLNAPQVQIVHFGGDAARKGFKHWWMFITSGIRFFRTHGWCVFQH